MKKARDCRPVPFGHAGDGNLHFNCQAPANSRRFAPYREDQRRDLRLVVAYGGDLGQHGIGRIKVDELAHYRSRSS
jgi:FAD/FMN-containing dehydrogenase